MGTADEKNTANFGQPSDLVQLTWRLNHSLSRTQHLHTSLTFILCNTYHFMFFKATNIAASLCDHKTCKDSCFQWKFRFLYSWCYKEHLSENNLYIINDHFSVRLFFMLKTQMKVLPITSLFLSFKADLHKYVYGISWHCLPTAYGRKSLITPNS